MDNIELKDNNKGKGKCISFLEKLIYIIYVVALFVSILTIILGLIALIYKIITSHQLEFLLGIKGEIFVSAILISLLAAFISNKLDKFGNK